jgi:hypothetical protein
MLFSSPSQTIVNNSLKKYIEESTNKYIQTIVKNGKVFEFIKTPIKCELCYLNDEHKLSDSEIIFFRHKFLNNSTFSNCSNSSNPSKYSENYLHFCLYFLSTSIFFFLDA